MQMMLFRKLRWWQQVQRFGDSCSDNWESVMRTNSHVVKPNSQWYYRAIARSSNMNPYFRTMGLGTKERQKSHFVEPSEHLWMVLMCNDL